MKKTKKLVLFATAALASALVATAFTVDSAPAKAEDAETPSAPEKTEVRVVEELSWEGTPTCGWGEVRKNQHNEGKPLKVGGTTYTENSIGTHMPGVYGNQDIVYDISEYSTEFPYVDLYVAMSDDAGVNNVIFSVLADDVVVDTVHWNWTAMGIDFNTANTPERHKPIAMHANVAGAKKLTLRICGGDETGYAFQNGACAFLDVKLSKETDGYTHAAYIYDRAQNPGIGGFSYGFNDGVLFDADIKGDKLAYMMYDDPISYDDGMSIHLKNVSYETYSASDESKADINNYVSLKWDLTNDDFSYFSALAYAALGSGYHVDAWIDGKEVYTSGKIDSIGTCVALGFDAKKAPKEIGFAIPKGAKDIELRIVADTIFNDGIVNLACPMFFDRGDKLCSVYGEQTAGEPYPMQTSRTYMRDGRRCEYYAAATDSNIAAEDGIFFVAGTSYTFDVSDIAHNTLQGIFGKADFGGLENCSAPLELRYTVEDKDGKITTGKTVGIDKSTSGKSVSIYIGNNAKTLTLSLYGDDPGHSECVLANALFIDKYSVTFNDGTTENTVTFDGGAALIAPQDPTRSGYTFGGWALDGESDAYDFTDKTVTANMRFNAIWVANKYSIDYWVKLGSAAPVDASADYPQGEYTVDASSPLPQAKDITGYDFVGWFVGDTLVETLAADTYCDDITVVARYVKKTFTVTFKSGDDTIDSRRVEYGDTVQSITAPDVLGYKFSGWNNGDNAFDFRTQITGDLTLTAVFAPERFSISYKQQLGASAATDADYDVKTHVFGTDTNLPTARNVDGYIFVGWYVGENAVAKLDGKTYFDNITVIAKYRKEPVKVVFVSDGVEYPVEYDNGQTATPKPLDKTGYEFVGWYTDEACTEAYNFDTPLTADVKLYAKWKKADVPDTDGKGDDGGNGLAIGLGVGGGVLAIGAAVAAAIVVRSKKKKKTQSEPQENGESGED